MSPRPRRLPSSPQQRRNRILTQTRGAHSARGDVPAARPVQAPRHSVPYAPAAVLGVVRVGDTSAAVADSSNGIAIESTSPPGYASTTVASGDNSIAIGVGAVGAGNQSAAVGYGAHALNQGSTAVGFDAYTYGDNSVAAGVNARVGSVSADKGGGVAVGFGALANGVNAVAIGASAQAGTDASPADSTVAIGVGAVTTTAHEIALGASTHITVIRGQLVIADGGTLYRLDATGGTLTLVAYP